MFLSIKVTNILVFFGSHLNKNETTLVDYCSSWNYFHDIHYHLFRDSSSGCWSFIRNWTLASVLQLTFNRNSCVFSLPMYNRWPAESNPCFCNLVSWRKI